MRNKKAFSVVEIILVIVIIGLIGAVGWVFWSNSQNIKNANTSTNKNNQPELKSYNADSGKLGFKFGFQYPTNWKIEEKYADKLEAWKHQLELSLYDPNNEIKINYTIYFGNGFGGGCNPDATEIISKGKVQSINNLGKVQNIKWLDGPSRLYEIIYTKNETVTYADTHISPYYDGPEIAVGDDFCAISFHSLLTPPEITRSIDNMELGAAITSSLILNALQSDNESMKPSISVNDVVVARNSETYKEAVNILLSTTYSKL